MRNFLFISALVLFFGCSNHHKTLQTPLEKAGYTNLSNSSEIGNFLNHCKKINPGLTVKVWGKTQNNKPVFLVKNFDKPDSSHLKVFLFGEQHGNEPSGKEGLLLLIKALAKGELDKVFQNIDLLIIPQVNPDGGDMNLRRNANNIDLNRNHLILTAHEAQLVQAVFHKYQPELTVDFHEYYPYGKSWEAFGYRKNFDIQLGGLTNINVDSSIRHYFYNTVFNTVKNQVENNGYSFFEYTLGGFPNGERLRHSTVDINDGRQSMGITNTMSFIVEGKRGKDSLHLIEKRAKSQYQTALGILKAASVHHNQIKQLVTRHRGKLKQHYADSIAIRLDHFKGPKPLRYPLVSVKTGNDTVFIVDEFHSEVKPLLKVTPPIGYLIPENDTLLVNWLKRSNFSYSKKIPNDGKIQQYEINKVITRVDEGLENFFAQVKKTEAPKIGQSNYLFVPTLQIYQYKIVTALEPQAMYGLVNYPEFGYLLKKDTYPVLRVE
jgi:hypothetical protein